MRLLRFDERQTVVFERLIGAGALVALCSADVSISAGRREPHLAVGGAPPFGPNAIYGMPLELLAAFAMALR